MEHQEHPEEQKINGQQTEASETDIRQQQFDLDQSFSQELMQRVLNGELQIEQASNLFARRMTAIRRIGERNLNRAYKDTTTGLPNKRYFQEIYRGLVDHGQPFGLLILDLDRFKGINDTHGHKIGDEVLAEAGIRMVSNVRRQDSSPSVSPAGERRRTSRLDDVFRVGGEEFALLLPTVIDQSGLETVAKKIWTAFRETPFNVGGKSVPVTASIGGGIFIGGDPAAFYERVDKKGTYAAKEKGRDRYVLLPATK